MKTRKLFYTASISLFTLLFFVSCTSNEDTMNETILETASRNDLQSLAPVLAHGKLIFVNDSPFELNAQIRAVGGIDNVTADTSLRGLTSVREFNTTIYDDFENVNIPQATVSSWNTNGISYSSSIANTTFGLFANGTDNNDGYYANWSDLKGDDFSALIYSTIPDQFGNYPSQVVRIRHMALLFPQNDSEVLDNVIPNTIGPLFTANDVPEHYLHFEYKAIILANGDIQATFTSTLDTNP